MHVGFTTGETEFRVSPLPIVESLRLLGILSESILPAAAAAITATDVSLDSVIPQVAAAATRIPAVFEAFLPYCEVSIGGNWLPLGPAREKVFARRAPLALAWLAECLAAEYADFFGETGRRCLGAAASRFQSLIGSTGGSGESQPTTG